MVVVRALVRLVLLLEGCKKREWLGEFDRPRPSGDYIPPRYYLLVASVRVMDCTACAG